MLSKQKSTNLMNLKKEGNAHSLANELKKKKD